MKTQDTDIPGGTSSSPPALHTGKTHRRFAGIGAVIAIALIVGLSAIVFAQLAQHHGSKQQTPPNAGQWEQVLKGYTITSLVAARNDPSVLYACATQSQNTATSNSGQSTSYTVLRSSDFGTHWQNIGSSAALAGDCDLAVNPLDSNDVYAVGLTSDNQAHEVLRHSTDGGQTWNTIVPTIHMPGTGAPTAMLWNVQQISIEGNRLFGLQWMPSIPLPVNSDVRPVSGLLQRLVTSSDGGHTWTVIDGQFIAQRLGARSYAVDPTNPSTIYEVVGTLWFEVETPFQTNDVLPAFGLNGELYKTTDGGANWHLLRKDLTFISQVQLASSNPQIVYIGGAIVARPLITTQPYTTEAPTNGTGYPTNALYPAGFQLSMSGDGGATWRDIVVPANAWGIRTWFVSPDGQVYLSPLVAYSGTQGASIGASGSGASGVQSTAIVSTAVAVPGQKVLIPPTPANSGTGAPSTHTNQAPPTVILPDETAVVPTVPPQSQAIQRYNPTTGKWNQVTNPPASGLLLAVTPSGTNDGVALWFLGLGNGNELLYRYITG